MMSSGGHIGVGKKQAFIVVTLLVLFFVGQAGASFTCTSNDAITINVVSTLGSATYTVNPSASPADPFDWDEVFANPGTKYNWYLPDTEQFDIYDGAAKLAHVSQLSFAVQADPVMDFGFSVEAFAEGTTFTISSPLLTFSQIVNPSEVQAYSEVSATPGTTKVTGNLPGGKVYRAAYNAGGVFADLVDSPIAIPSPIAGEGTGVQSIAGGVTSMQGIYSFSLSTDLVPNSWSADAISQYSIVPEPATLALLGLGSLVIRRRKA
jgi:PEP-CTERM motif-containing protein